MPEIDSPVPDDVFTVLPPDPSIVVREQPKAGAYRIRGTDVEAEVRRLTTTVGVARSSHMIGL